MDVQRVHGEVVGVQVQPLEQLLQGHVLPVHLPHHALGVHAVRVLDEAQQVLLVHAGRRVDVGVHLPAGGGHRESEAWTGFIYWSYLPRTFCCNSVTFCCNLYVLLLHVRSVVTCTFCYYMYVLLLHVRSVVTCTFCCNIYVLL